MAETRPYVARKADGDDSWEVYNKESKLIVEAGLTEEDAKSHADLGNEMYAEASKEEASDGSE